jgi:xylose dehydrogenase (NAD/NADP)
VRWGFLGAARIARSALAPAVQAAGHRIDAVAARDGGRARQFAADFGIPRAYEGYDALIADPALNAIYIALPNDAHLPWTLKALMAGKHVLCEKPLALNAAEVAQIRQAEHASGCLVMEAYCHIHHPQAARARAIVASGALGRLIAMQGSHANPLCRDSDFRWSRAMGGGALLDLDCYILSAMRLFSGLEPVRVSAAASMRGDVDATLWASMEFGPTNLGPGVAAQLLCSFDAARSQRLELLGTDGRLALDWPCSARDRVATLELNGVAEHFAPTNPYIAMVSHFADAVAGRASMLFPVAASLAQARAHDALLAAVASGGWVTVAR